MNLRILPRGGGNAATGISRRTLLGGTALGAAAVPWAPGWRVSAAAEDWAVGAAGSEPQQLVDFGTTAVSAVAFAASGRFAVTDGGPSSGGTVTLWDVLTGHAIRRFPPLGASVARVALLEDRLVAGGTSGRFTVQDRLTLARSGTEHVRVWDATSGRELGGVDLPRGNPLSTLAFLPDGSGLLIGPYFGAIGLHEVGTGRLVRALDDSALMAALAPVPGERRAVGGGSELRLWDLDTGKVLASARLSGFARGIAVSPDGRTALVALADPPGLDLVDLAAGQILRRFGAHPKPVTSAAFSPDGSLAASQGWDLTIRIWSVETGEQVAAFGPSYRHTSHSGGIAFPTRRAVLTKGAFGLYGWHLGSEPGAN